MIMNGVLTNIKSHGYKATDNKLLQQCGLPVLNSLVNHRFHNRETGST